MKFVIELQEVVVDDGNQETINVWEIKNFSKKSEANNFANELAYDIRNHYVDLRDDSYCIAQSLSEFESKENSIGIVIAQYYSERWNGCDPFVQKDGSIPNGIIDVFDIAIIKDDFYL